MSIAQAAEQTRSRRRAREDLARLRVLEAAEIEFGAAAFEDARMHAIAERAKVALGTLYTLFQGKHELFEAIHARRLEELFTEIAPLLVEFDEPAEAFRIGFDALTGFFVARPHYLAMHLRDGLAWSSPENMRTEVQRESWSRGFEMMRGLFEAAAEAGAVYPGDPALNARLAIAMHQVYLARWLETEPRVDAATIGAAIRVNFERTFLMRASDGTEERRCPK